MAVGSQREGTIQISPKKSAWRMAPTTMYGRRRPQREWVLSEIRPMIGSMMPSKSRGRESARPISTGSSFNVIW